MTIPEFQQDILQGIPRELPIKTEYDFSINHAPKRKQILSKVETRLALENALRYFPKQFHAELAPEFLQELINYGRIYMYRFRPNYKMYARPIEDYPGKRRRLC